MAFTDLTEEQASQSVKISGSSLTGVETNYMDVDINGKAKVVEVANVSCLDKVATLVAATPQEAKVGASRLTNRIYVILEAQVTGVKWGFSNTTQSFNAYKGQKLFIPAGDTVTVYVLGSGACGIGEMS
jgi:hypothetical protein